MKRLPAIFSLGLALLSSPVHAATATEYIVLLFSGLP